MSSPIDRKYPSFGIYKVKVSVNSKPIDPAHEVSCECIARINFLSLQFFPKVSCECTVTKCNNLKPTPFDSETGPIKNLDY